ncbi:hypothetical protein LC065_12750 [Halobacillus litoralis]|uniref:hypothetical protein n=1 Tax=Halobacillus litoralis TaxID=45668 RepID=UPI001CFF1DC5|nr:hypothetical protein [Halobacillus litoralis]WLR46445.1 hypothetical protein LC065_12750 [Halobacillus litoralis]
MKAILWIIGSIGTVVIAIVFLFIYEMTPDASKETKAEAMGEEYIQKHFEGKAEVYDVLYDNMGNHEFDYAAKVTHKSTGVDFLIYQARDSGKVKDTYAKSFYENQIEKDLQPFVSGMEGVVSHLVHIPDVPVEYQGEDELPEFKDLNLVPSVIIDLNREARDDDKETLEGLFVFMKENLEIERGSGRFVYDPSSGDETLDMSY